MPLDAPRRSLPVAAKQVLSRIRTALPKGQTLPDEVWQKRHRALLALLVLHAVALPVYALVQGTGLLHSLEHGAAPAALAGLGYALRHRRRIAATLVSVGLITCSALVVHISGGVIEAHFHFFVVLVLLSLYEDWLPFLLAATYVVLHHGLVGVLDSDSVYNHADAIAHPWKWAAIHGAFVTAVGVGSVAAWRLNENIRSETREAYQRARESEERFKSAFENAPIGMVLTSLDAADFGRFIQVNSAICAITGYSRETLTSKTLSDITHPDDREESKSLTERLLAGEFPSFQLDKRYVRPDGSIMHVLVAISLVRDSFGTPLHCIGQIQDVTERKHVQDQLAYQAYHDQLTGLPNRRKLMADLDKQLRVVARKRPLTLILFDLDGFKSYNDSFGHPAGDALLARLGKRLAAAMAGHGEAYRMGGDEFCVLAPLGAEGPDTQASTAAAALSEEGEAFKIGASYGFVILPAEASDGPDALRKADQRMYARKGKGRSSAGQQAADALLSALSERSPDLGAHLRDVTDLCEEVARALGLPDGQMASLLQAAALHDVGKVAIPDAILQKPAPLDEAEWKFMRTHTLIGERILGAAPALSQAARIVRSSHERFDGRGYPDGLVGDEIPLGAYIIAVCDAYDAMRSDRPYRKASSLEGAISELRRNAGTQFHPDVVDAFVAAVAKEQSVALGRDMEVAS